MHKIVLAIGLAVLLVGCKEKTDDLSGTTSGTSTNQATNQVTR